jgi:hypothetical protein
MPKTHVRCPNCRQPIVADIQQKYDLNVDPTAKQKLLSGAFNLVSCPNCGYQGNYPTPIVYHDPDKELLLTFVPPDIDLPRDEQERIIGSMINQIVDKLPQEKRKGYLFQPQASLTMQGLVERILEADGISREMIQAQQKKLNLIQRLLNASEESRQEIAQQEDEMIDAEFFSLISRLVENSLISGDRESAQKLADLQQLLLPLTTYGKQIQEQTQEIEAAMQSLQEAGENLTREKLLELVLDAPNPNRLRALVSLARPGMDYQFFQRLSERIDKARGADRGRLIELREQLLDLTKEIDRQVQARANQARQLLESILQADNVGQATVQNLPAVDEFFLQELNQQLDQARKENNQDRLNKLQEVVSVLQQLSATPHGIEVIEEMLDADKGEWRRIMEENQEAINQDFLETLTNLMTQSKSETEPELAQRLQEIHRQALRFSMEKNLNQ